MLLLNELTSVMPILTNGGIVAMLSLMAWYFFQHIKELNQELVKQRQGFEGRLDKVLTHQKNEFMAHIQVLKDELNEERKLTKDMFDKTLSRLEKYDGWLGDMVKIIVHKQNEHHDDATH